MDGRTHPKCRKTSFLKNISILVHTYLMPFGSGTYCPTLKSGGRAVQRPAAQASQVRWNTILFELIFPWTNIYICYNLSNSKGVSINALKVFLWRVLLLYIVFRVVGFKKPLLKLSTLNFIFFHLKIYLQRRNSMGDIVCLSIWLFSTIVSLNNLSSPVFLILYQYIITYSLLHIYKNGPGRFYHFMYVSPISSLCEGL